LTPTAHLVVGTPGEGRISKRIGEGEHKPKGKNSSENPQFCTSICARRPRPKEKGRTSAPWTKL